MLENYDAELAEERDKSQYRDKGKRTATIKTGYSLFAIDSADTPAQILFAGCRFTPAGILSILLGGSITVVAVPGLLMLLYLAFVSAAAYSLWGLLLKYNPVSRVTVFAFMNPVSGVILSTLLLKENSQASGIVSLFSLVLVCIGIYIVNRFNRPEV